MSQYKRNPFKRGGASNSKSATSNPLSHLTDKAIGFTDADDSSGVAPLECNDSENAMMQTSSSAATTEPPSQDENSENNAVNEVYLCAAVFLNYLNAFSSI